MATLIIDDIKSKVYGKKYLKQPAKLHENLNEFSNDFIRLERFYNDVVKNYIILGAVQVMIVMSLSMCLWIVVTLRTEI